jgi:putative ABC transport system ATP-binding protein
MTVVVITHNSAVAPMADRVIHIRSGTVDAVERNPRPPRWNRSNGDCS